MSDNDRQKSETFSWSVPDEFINPLFVGLFLLIGVVTILLFRYQYQPIQRVDGRSEPPGQRTKSEPEHNGEEHTTASEEQTGEEFTSPFRVQRSREGVYTFFLDDRLEMIEAGARVSVSLHWQDQSIDQYNKRLSVQSEGGVTLEWSPGGPEKQIPPGVYRIRISGSNMLRTPRVLARLPEYLSEQEQNHAEMLMLSDRQALEYAVSVGSAKEVRQFHKEILCELKRRGRSLVSAWNDWLEFARSSYEKDRDPKTVSKELFDRFMAVRSAVKHLRGWIEEQEERYVLLPYRNLRGELLKRSYVLSEKVNALSMTVLKQVGISPWSWPGAYVRRGFGSNINVLRYMSQYDQEAIHDVETAIDETQMDLPYYDLQTYALDRITSLVQYIDQFRKLNTHPYRQIIRLQLAGNGASGEHQFRSVERYVKDIIQIRKKGLRGIIPEVDPASARASYQDLLRMIPTYSTSVFQKLERSWEINRSDRSDPSTQRSVQSVRERIDQRLKSIESRERSVSDDELKCE